MSSHYTFRRVMRRENVFVDGKFLLTDGRCIFGFTKRQSFHMEMKKPEHKAQAFEKNIARLRLKGR